MGSIKVTTARRAFFVLSLAVPLFLILVSELKYRPTGASYGNTIGLQLDQFAVGTTGQSTAAALAPYTSSTEDYRLPPLESILSENGTVIGNPQSLLHFATIGFGKCGTTSLMRWLADHPELQSLKSEVWALVGQEPERLIRRLHRKLTLNKKRGYKCPGDILADYVLDYYRDWWPQTKFFVAIRHPVEFFSSLYNFRVQNFKKFQRIPHPNDLIGVCTDETSLICSRRGHFAFYLMRLGKHLRQPRPYTDLEQRIANWYPSDPLLASEIIPMPQDVFLFELNQLADLNLTRRNLLARDIEKYLGLSQPLPQAIHVTPGKTWNESVQAAKDRRKIDICDPEFVPVRSELMELAKMASVWIRSTFLDQPGVYYSSREYLEELLESWLHDPCVAKRNQTDGTGALGMPGLHLQGKFSNGA